MFYPGQGPLGTDLSWGMFTLTGNPAYYMLYKGIAGKGIGIDGEDELTEEERQRR